MTRRTRKIVRIDEDKCDGCGLCVPDCAEGAIQIIDGKARLVAENLCDGLGNCLRPCPKLDDVQPYTGKLASIFANNTIRSLTVAHMEVPCYSGIVALVKGALQRSGRTDIPLRDVTVGISGSIVDEG